MRTTDLQWGQSWLTSNDSVKERWLYSLKLLHKIQLKLSWNEKVATECTSYFYEIYNGSIYLLRFSVCQMQFKIYGIHSISLIIHIWFSRYLYGRIQFCIVYHFFSTSNILSILSVKSVYIILKLKCSDFSEVNTFVYRAKNC